MNVSPILLCASLWTMVAAAAPAGAPTPPPTPLAGGAGPFVPPPRPRWYGDRGTSEIALGMGYGSDAGFQAEAGFRYFVVDGVAPGVEATYVGGGTLFSRVGLLLGALRLVPLRTGNLALVLTGRAGRVLLANHDDGWAAGGGGGVIIFFGGDGQVGLEIGYQVLRLLPGSFCADLASCVMQGPVLGLRLSF